MRRILSVLLLLLAAFLLLPAMAGADVVFDAAVTQSATENPPRDPAAELLGDESGRPSVWVIVAGLAAAGGVAAVAIGRARQRNQLDGEDRST